VERRFKSGTLEKSQFAEKNILKPITIRTPSNEPIYQFTVQTTREVTGVTGYTARGGSNGVVTLDWNIFEHNDAVKLQLIYNGGVRFTLFLDGIIEGQAKFNVVKSEREFHLYKRELLLSLHSRWFAFR